MDYAQSQKLKNDPAEVLHEQLDEVYNCLETVKQNTAKTVLELRNLNAIEIKNDKQDRLLSQLSNSIKDLEQKISDFQSQIDNKLSEKSDADEQSLNDLQSEVETLKEKFDEFKTQVPEFGKILEKVKGDKGEKGDNPTKDELVALIEPLIPTETDLKALISPLLPTDKDLQVLIKPFIPSPIKGEKGDKPIAGVDYPIPKDGIDGVSLAGRDGKDGEKGEMGKMPKHEWNETKTKVRFEIAPNKWGEWSSDLRGEKGRSKFLGGTGRGINFSESEIPSGAINGVNTIFTTTNTPAENSLKVFVGGARMKLTDDYTLAVSTITFVVAPPTGSNILVDYRW